MIILLLAVVFPLHARAASTDLTIEMIAFYDNEFSKAFQKLIPAGTRKSDFVSSLMNSVNKKLELLLSDVNVTVFLAKVNVESTFSTNPHHPDIIKVPDDVKKFEERQRTDAEVKRADLVFMLTRGTLVPAVPNGQGHRENDYAVKGSLCSQDKFVLARIKPQFNDYTIVMTRDILTVLNADKDGEGSATKCPASEKKLMSGALEPAIPWTFSSCTKESVGEYIKTLAESCKQRHFRSRAYGRYNRTLLPGELFDRNKACSSLGAKPKHDCTNDTDKRNCRYKCCDSRTAISSHTTTFLDGGYCESKKKCINAQCV